MLTTKKQGSNVTNTSSQTSGRNLEHIHTHTQIVVKFFIKKTVVPVRMTEGLSNSNSNKKASEFLPSGLRRNQKSRVWTKGPVKQRRGLGCARAARGSKSRHLTFLEVGV